MKSKKIGFFGLFGQHNLGNDCTLLAMLSNTQKYLPDAELLCSCTGPEDVSVRYKIETFPIREEKSSNVLAGHKNILVKILRKLFLKTPMEILHWIKAINTFSGVDILITPGTGFLIDQTTGPFGFPYYIFKWAVIAKLCRSKLMFVSIGAGSIDHPLSRWFIRFALSLADYRSYRDSFSKQYIEDTVYKKTDDAVYPDLAFSLPLDMMPVPNNSEQDRPVIGIGLIDYPGPRKIQRSESRETLYREYINKMVKLIAWFLDNEYCVRLLIGDAKYDNSVKSDLIELLSKLKINYDDQNFFNDSITTEEQLIPQLAETDVVISPRFHNIILALMLNKPVISISYNEKFDELMAGVGLEEYCHHIDYFDVNALIKQCISLKKNAANIKSHIAEKTEQYRRALDEQYSLIFNMR